MQELGQPGRTECLRSPVSIRSYEAEQEEEDRKVQKKRNCLLDNFVLSVRHEPEDKQATK